ncbi:MAG: twin-arginine translocase TatA/TatE family subunit [Deltaproteobacteria bacterium]|nr:twin-arginine translocase TatA/TatE family subunit [Deltaproteobacteria bacterium]
MLGLGPWELVIVGGVVVLLFGAKRLPQLGEGLGKSITEFKRAVRDDSPAEKNSENERKQQD